MAHSVRQPSPPEIARVAFVLGALFSLLLVLRPSAALAQETPPPIEIESVTPAEAGLGNQIRVKLRNLPAGLDNAKRAEISGWVVYIDGLPIAGLVPEGPLTSDGVLQYYLARTDVSRDSWTRLFRRLAFKKGVVLGVGPPTGGTVVAPVEPNFSLLVIRRTPFFLMVAGFIGIAIALMWFGGRSGLLREPGPWPDDALKRFSLGRVQMAFWFLLVLGAYLFIGLVTLDFSGTISASALGLLGISTVTALGATFIDGDKIARARALRVEHAHLTERKAALANASSAREKEELEAAAKRTAEIDNELSSLPSNRPSPSRGLLYDLIQDENGASLHRFQIAVWTIVLGGVFVAGSIRELAMPEFSATLLALMGISSGTYLGFKFPERK